MAKHVIGDREGGMLRIRSSTHRCNIHVARSTQKLRKTMKSATILRTIYCRPTNAPADRPDRPRSRWSRLEGAFIPICFAAPSESAARTNTTRPLFASAVCRPAWSLEPLERPTLEHLERPMVAGVAGAADAGALGAADGRWGRWSGRRWSTWSGLWSLEPLERPTLASTPQS